MNQLCLQDAQTKFVKEASPKSYFKVGANIIALIPFKTHFPRPPQVRIFRNITIKLFESPNMGKIATSRSFDLNQKHEISMAHNILWYN